VSFGDRVPWRTDIPVNRTACVNQEWGRRGLALNSMTPREQNFCGFGLRLGLKALVSRRSVLHSFLAADLRSGSKLQNNWWLDNSCCLMHILVGGLHGMVSSWPWTRGRSVVIAGRGLAYSIVELENTWRTQFGRPYLGLKDAILEHIPGVNPHVTKLTMWLRHGFERFWTYICLSARDISARDVYILRRGTTWLMIAGNRFILGGRCGL